MGLSLWRTVQIVYILGKPYLKIIPRHQQELEVKEMGLEKSPELPPPDGIIREIFDASMSQNTQISVTKKIRERLGIEKGDILFVQILKVISPTGDEKYAWKGVNTLPESGEVVSEEEKQEGN